MESDKEEFCLIVLFMFIHDLSLNLNACGIGCRVGDSLINHLMYADDLVIFSPYSADLQQLLSVCSHSMVLSLV